METSRTYKKHFFKFQTSVEGGKLVSCKTTDVEYTCNCNESLKKKDGVRKIFNDLMTQIYPSLMKMKSL